MRICSLLLPSLLVISLGSCRSNDNGSNDAPANPDSPSGSDVEESSGSAAPTRTVAPGRSATSSQGGGLIDEAADRAVRLSERRGYLAQESVARGNEFLDRANLDAALLEFAQALEVDPSNEEARRGLRKVQAFMGDRYALAGESMDDAVMRQTVRTAQARIAAEQHNIDGDNYRRLGEYDQAIESYRRAEMVLRYHPLVATQSLDEMVVTRKLTSTIAESEEARRADEAASREAARQEREAEEAQADEYRTNKLRTLYAQASVEFQRENYSLAESLAAQILLHDPGNETAIEMRDVAQAARHQKVNEDTRKRYREKWLLTFEELNTLPVPQTDTLVYDDLERWKEVLQRGSYEFSHGDPTSQADKEAILSHLREVRVPARFGVDGEGAALEDVAGFLQSVSGVNFLISAAVRDELDEEETSVLLDLPERSVFKILQMITEVRESLRWKVEDSVVKFVTAEEMVGGQVLRMYEVRDLIRPITDFPGREINVEPSGGIEEFDEEFEEREALVITEDRLDGLIRDNISPMSWDDDPSNSMRISQGTLVVNQTPEVQAQIQQLLANLREATGIMVDIQARFLKVEDNFLEDIGVDFRGLGSPGAGTNDFFNDFGNASAQSTLGNELGGDTTLGAYFDDGEDGDMRARIENLYGSQLGDSDTLTSTGGLGFQWTYLNDLQLEMILRAVSKSERIELVTAPRLTVFNTARSNLTVMNQVAYVKDFDVEIAQASSIADPIIDVVQDGVILDVRPVVSADRRFLTLELRPTVAELKRPIRTFNTSLGVSGNSVAIHLPELEISRVRTSVPMPDGGTVLLGGFKVHESQDLRSGVPILNKIPLISFLFERKGTFVSNRRLLILLKANIVIPAELEPTAAQLGLDGSFADPR
jgi:Flp pilus assembly secretin CpaC/tetratricopeptide (TPR) repeat protein